MIRFILITLILSLLIPIINAKEIPEWEAKLQLYSYYDFVSDEIKASPIIPVVKFNDYLELIGGADDNDILAGLGVSLLNLSEKFNWEYLPDFIDIKVIICSGYNFQDEEWILGIGLSLISIEF
ncbi:MAG: hypothetical protein ACTSRP_01950 [Candidatus Helarchaeota archaeon]